MKHKFSKVFFVVVMLLVVCLLAVACNPDDKGDNTTPEKYAVTYVGGEGSTGTAPTDNQTYAKDATVTLLGKGTLDKEDNKFGGWKYGGQTYQPGATFKMPANAVQFEAVWIPKNLLGQADTTYVALLVLDLDENTGFIEISNADDSITTVNLTYTLNDTALAITLANDGGTFNGTLVDNVITINITYNSKTYEFKAEEPAPTTAPTVTFDANGGTGTAPEATVEKTNNGYKISIPQNPYTAPAGKEFKAWEIIIDDESIGERNPGNSLIAQAGEDVIIKAVWQDLYISNVSGLTYLGSCKVPTTTVIGGVQAGGQTYIKFVVSISDEEQSVSYQTNLGELTEATSGYVDTLPKAASDPVAVPCLFAKLADNLGYYLVLSNDNEVLTIYDLNGDPLENGVFNVHYSNPETYEATSTDGNATISLTFYDDEYEPCYDGNITIGNDTTINILGTPNPNNNDVYFINYSGDNLGKGSFYKGERLDFAVLYNNQYYIFGNAQVEQFTVTFDPKNGDEATTYTVGKGIKVTVPAAPSISDGRTFKNWKNTLGATYVPGAQIAINGNWTINAEYVWTVNFLAGEGATGTVANHTVVDWSVNFVVLPDSTGLTYVGGGKHFAGWTCDGGETVLPAGTHYSDGTGNVTFTAVWEDDTPVTPPITGEGDYTTYNFKQTGMFAYLTINGKRIVKIELDLTTGNVKFTLQDGTVISGTSESYTSVDEDYTTEYMVQYDLFGDDEYYWLRITTSGDMELWDDYDEPYTKKGEFTRQA
ncbi:MAG: InlB B-repeat-containing protein [Clostridia bacterium]|nr:InlB B-repeat-containing protein [Clostridia bacterium]